MKDPERTDIKGALFIGKDQGIYGSRLTKHDFPRYCQFGMRSHFPPSVRGKFMYPVYFMILSVAIGIVQILFWDVNALTAFLLGSIISNIGLQGIFGFMGHFFRADEVAKGIGWPTGSPFQREIAFANLGMGFLGILSIWFREDFWMATIVAKSVYSWGAAYGHILDLKKRGNTNVYNAGPVLYDDILLPFVLIGLYIAAVIV